jgi:hypothetical protein
MGSLVRQYARRVLGPSGTAGLRGVGRHVTAAYSILRGRMPQASDTDFTALDVEALLAGLKLFRQAQSEESKDQLAVQLMKRVAVDQRYIDLVQSRYFRADAPEPLGGLLAGAALFGGGRLEEAFDTLTLTLDGHPSVRTFYCAARCASHGLLDYRRSLEIAEAGLRHYPDSVLLTLVAAVAAYRVSDSGAANRLLEGRHAEIARLLAGAFPGIDALQAELDRAIASGAESRETSYSDDAIDTYWNLLWRSMACFTRFQNGWASMRWLQRTKLEAALRGDARDVTTFLNFGAFCAQVDADLAERFPSVDFHGIDLGARTKALNERAFRRQNLHFHDRFILDFLDETPVGLQPTMLFHARTTTLFYPKFVERFYQTCAAKGIRYLALWENNSLSYSSARFHDFGKIPNGSVAYRNVMFIHDYTTLLERAGYQVLQAERSPSNQVLIEEDALAADGHIFVLARLR